MKALSMNEISCISGGENIYAGLAAAGLVNAGLWAGWTYFIDHRPEKVT